MRKIFLFIAFISMYFLGQAQYAPTSAKTRFVNGIGLSTKDTSSLTNAGDTLVIIMGMDSVPYVKYKGYWKALAYRGASGVTSVATNNGTGITGGTITNTGTIAADTSILATRLRVQKGIDSVNANVNLRVKYTDTASMLSNYYNKTVTNSLLNTKLNISDTAAMLSPYARTSNLPSLAPYVKYTDTASMLSPYQRSYNAMKYTDTATMLSSYYNKTATNSLLSSKLNISDTSSMLSGYKTYYPRNAISGGTGISYNSSTGVITNSSPSLGGTVTSVATDATMTGGTITTSGTLKVDTTIMATRLRVQKGIDSVNANVNLRVKYSDTATMLSSYYNKTATDSKLALKLNISDTATMLSPYQRTSNAITSVGLSMPVAFTVSNTPLTSNGTISVTGAGTSSQYIRGDGQLATYNNGGGGGGSSVNYYLNGGTAASVSTYYQMSNTAVIGTGANFSTATNGLISQFLTDAGNPNSLTIPAGAWTFQLYFSASSAGGTPTYYVELYKYSVGGTFTLIASNSGSPDGITSGTATELYVSNLPVPTTTLLATDRLAVRIYVATSGKTITLYTQDSHLCKIVTTFSSGISALNGLTANTQYFATGTSGTDFAISSLTDTHTFNLPTASATNRGALSSANWTTFNNKIAPSDTATMLSPYLRSTNYGLLKSSQTVSADSSLLSTKLWRQKGIDSVQANVNLKVNISDTATMLSGYKTYYPRAALSAGTGITYNASTGVITNSSPSSGGTVTSVATDATLTGGTITTSGTLKVDTSVMATRLRVQKGIDSLGAAKQNVLTNPITGTGTTNYLTKFTGTSTIGNSLLYDNGTTVQSNGRVGILTAPSSTYSLKVRQANFEGIQIEEYNYPTNYYTYFQSFYNNSTWSVNSYFANIGGSGYTSDGTGTLGSSIALNGGTGDITFYTAQSGTAGTLAPYLTPIIIKNGGNILIGTSTDAGYKLDVNGTGRFSGALTGTTATFITGATNGLNFKFSSGYGNSSIIFDWDSGADANNAISFKVNNAAGTAVQALRLDGTGAATFSSSISAGGDILVPYDGTNRFIGERFYTGTYYNGLRLNGGTRSTGVVSGSGDATDYIWFGTNTATERMRITNGGDVGIGTTSITSGTKLEVTGNISIKSGTDAYFQTTDGNNVIVRADQQSGTSGKGVYLQYWNTSGWQTGLYILNNGSAGTYSPLVLQQSGGNVLIGTGTDAGYKLDVNGTVRFTGALTGTSAMFSGNLTFTGAGSKSIGWGGNTSSAAAYPLIYSDNSYLAINSKAGSALYFNFDNTNSASTVDFFAGRATISYAGAATFSSSVTAPQLQLTGTLPSGNVAFYLSSTIGTPSPNGMYLAPNYTTAGTSFMTDFTIQASSDNGTRTTSIHNALVINDIVKGTGHTITNNYGLIINNIAAGTNNTALSVGMGLSQFLDKIELSSTLKLGAYSVAGLPTAGTAGRIAYVTDALAPTYGATVVGGGSVKTLVFDNGTNWTVH